MGCEEGDEKHDVRASKRDEKFKDQKAMHESVYNRSKDNWQRWKDMANLPIILASTKH